MRAFSLIVCCVVAFGAACQDPCVALAERICNCEPTPTDRRACRQERITNQQSKIEITDADREVCTAALDTCDCKALDENDLEKCGFVPGAEG